MLQRRVAGHRGVCCSLVGVVMQVWAAIDNVSRVQVKDTSHSLTMGASRA